MMAKLRDDADCHLCWNATHFKAVSDAKTSVIDDHNSHHGSIGKYYSFGNKAAYKTINKSSISQYVMKKGISEEKEMKCLTIDELVKQELRDGITNIGKIIPDFHNSIAPVFKVADHLQQIYGDANLKLDEYTEYGIWKSVVTCRIV